MTRVGRIVLVGCLVLTLAMLFIGWRLWPLRELTATDFRERACTPSLTNTIYSYRFIGSDRQRAYLSAWEPRFWVRGHTTIVYFADKSGFTETEKSALSQGKPLPCPPSNVR